MEAVMLVKQQICALTGGVPEKYGWRCAPGFFAIWAQSGLTIGKLKLGGFL